MKIYNYASDTKEFIGMSDADASPLEPGQFLIPAFATVKPPPATGANQRAVYSEISAAWSIVPDYRGKYFDKDNQAAHEIDGLGVIPGANWTATAPNGPYQIFDDNIGAWVSDLAAMRGATWRRLEADMHNYIFTVQDYPQPTQITLQAIYADPESNAGQRAACKSIFNWIKSAVLPYYYTKKIEILSSQAPEGVSWDFPANCDGSAPGLTLAQILQMT
jgi:hypothetical protein